MNSDDLEAELAGLQPKTKIGKLRKYMSVIEQKLAEGAAVQDIVDILKRHDIEMTVGTFRHYLHQYRKQQKAGQVSKLKMEKVIEKNLSDMPDTSGHRLPVSVQELTEIMQPDPNKLAVDIAEKEKRYKEHAKSLKRKKE